MHSGLSRLVPDGIRKSYLRQFAAAVAVVLVILVFVLGGVYATEKQAREDSVRETLASNTERNAEQVAEWRTKHTSSAQIVSQSSRLRIDRAGSLETELSSTARKMPAEVVGVHLVNWTNGSVIASSRMLRDNASEHMPWLSALDFEQTGVSTVQVSDGYRLDDDARVAFVSPTQFGIDYAVALEVSVTDSFSFRDPVSDSRTRVLHRNATVLYDGAAVAGTGTLSGSDATNASAGTPPNFGTGAVYDGPAAATLSNATAFVPGVTRFRIDDSGGNATVVEADGTVVSYAKVPGEKMAVVTTTSDAAFGVGAETKLYLGLVFLFVAVGLGAVGLLVERPMSRSISRLAERTEKIENGDLDVDLETDRIDEIGTLYGTFASMRDSLAARIDAVEAAREEARADAEAARQEAEDARERAERFTEHLEATADDYGGTIRACADGDLTRRLDPDDESEAMAEIARAFNDTMCELEATVARVRAFADEVAGSTARATTATQRVRDTSRDVSDAVRTIADDAAEQDEYLQDATAEMNDLSATVEEVAATADNVAELARETESLATDGASAASEAMTEMETIESATAETAAEIRALDDEVGRVAEIVDLIDGIAQQTNTLALNASIEAARAGESGQGFAVVADEVKQLAEETSEATRNIDELLSQLSDRTSDAVEDIEAMREDVVGGVETTQGALDALDDIAEQVRETNEGVQGISAATDDQADSTQEAVSLTDRAAEISDRTAGRAESTASTTTDQAASLDDVARTAESIETQAQDLTDVLDDFTVESDERAVDDGSFDPTPDLDEGADPGPDPDPDLDPDSNPEPEPLADDRTEVDSDGESSTDDGPGTGASGAVDPASAETDGGSREPVAEDGPDGESD